MEDSVIIMIALLICLACSASSLGVVLYVTRDSKDE